MANCTCSVETVQSFGLKQEAWGLVCKHCGGTAPENVRDLLAEADAAREERERLEAELERERKAQEQKALEERQKFRVEEINRRLVAWEAELQKNAEGNQDLTAYHSVYLPVDSVVLEQTVGNFDITQLRAFGLMGWKVVAVIPRTQGEGLKNYSTGSTIGETWGAAMGGNVVGVHVLLERPIRELTDELRQEALELGENLIREGFNLQTMEVDL